MTNGDYSLNFACPTCGANPQEKCELNSGIPRFVSHVERWDVAKDYLRDTKLRKKSPLSTWMQSGPQA
jgi:hypothetical protein